jgi:trigger factor
VLYEDAFESLFPEVYAEAVETHSLELVDRPDVDLVQMERGKELIFTAEVTLKPEVELGDYKGIEIEKVAYPVTDEMIDKEVESARERASRYVNVERKAQMGDRVNIDYLGTIDGVPFEGGASENHPLDLGAERFIPGFEEQVVGLAAGEEGDVKVTFPEEYHAKELAGKEAVFHVLVHSVKEKEMPELDDEFAKDVSEFDTLDEYKADIRQKMEEQAKTAEERAIESAVVKKVCDNAAVEIPEAMVKAQYNGILNEMRQNLAYQGLKIEDYFKYTGMDEDAMYENYKQESYDRAKTQLVIEAICKAQDVQVTDEEVHEEITRIAEKNGQDPQKFLDMFKGQNLDEFKEEMSMRKTVEVLVGQAVLVDAAPEEEKESEPNDTKDTE